MSEQPSDDAPIRISVSDTESGREYRATMADREGEAELEVSRVNAELVIAAHTEVPASMSGMGVGVALVERLIEDARTEGFSIIPLCPFVKAQYGRNPDWADVMK